jgi:hypothetical protein
MRRASGRRSMGWPARPRLRGHLGRTPPDPPLYAAHRGGYPEQAPLSAPMYVETSHAVFSLFLSAFSLRLSPSTHFAVSRRCLPLRFSAASPPSGVAGFSNSSTIDVPCRSGSPQLSALCAFRRRVVKFKFMNIATLMVLPPTAAWSPQRRLTLRRNFCINSTTPPAVQRSRVGSI